MLKQIFLSFLFFKIILFAYGQQQPHRICRNESVGFYPYNYFWFNSLNYASALEKDYKCFINVTLNGNETDGFIWMYFFTTYQLTSPQFSTPLLHFEMIQTNTSYLFSTNDYFNSDKLILPFQGFMFYDDSSDENCPLESLTQDTPLNITTEIWTTYVRSSYYENHLRKYDCRWKFIAPEGYGFKVVIIELNLIGNSFLIVENSTNYNLIREDPVKFHPYYNSDNHLQIFLSKTTHSHAIVNMEFGAYITIFINKPKIPTANCQTKIINNARIDWSGPPDGYANNRKCDYTFTVYAGTEVTLIVNQLNLETNADFIRYSDEFGMIKTLQFDDKIVFEVSENDTKREVKMEFESDGSVQGEGFDMSFFTQTCTCSSPNMTALCDRNSTFYLTNTSRPIALYCGGMNCTHTIQIDSHCKDKLIAAEINLINLNSVFNDEFQIISNNRLVLNMFSPISKRMTVLHPNVKNIFTAVTYSSTKAKRIIITLSTFTGAIILPSITIFEAVPFYSPYYSVETKTLAPNNVFIVEVAPILTQTNALIEIASNLGGTETIQCITLYNNNSLTYSIDTDCFKDGTSADSQCNTTQRSVSVYIKSLPVPSPILLFQLPKEYRNGCVFEKNIFHLDKTYYQGFSKSLVAVANKNGYCRIFIMQSIEESKNTFPFSISNLWTTEAKENVKIYTGIKEKQQILEFNSTTASKWKNIVLFSEFYMIELPPNSSIKIDLCNYLADKCSFDGSKNYTISLLPISYSSLITTPFHGQNQKASITNYWENVCFANILFDERSIEFSIVQYNIPTNFNFLLMVNNSLPQNISLTGEHLTLQNVKVVNLCYGPAANRGDVPSSEFTGVTLVYKVSEKIKPISN